MAKLISLAILFTCLSLTLCANQEIFISSNYSSAQSLDSGSILFVDFSLTSNDYLFGNLIISISDASTDFRIMKGGQCLSNIAYLDEPTGAQNCGEEDNFMSIQVEDDASIIVGIDHQSGSTQNFNLEVTYIPKFELVPGVDLDISLKEGERRSFILSKETDATEIYIIRVERDGPESDNHLGSSITISPDPQNQCYQRYWSTLECVLYEPADYTIFVKNTDDDDDFTIATSVEFYSFITNEESQVDVDLQTDSDYFILETDEKALTIVKDLNDDSGCSFFYSNFDTCNIRTQLPNPYRYCSKAESAQSTLKVESFQNYQIHFIQVHPSEQDECQFMTKTINHISLQLDEVVEIEITESDINEYSIQYFKFVVETDMILSGYEISVEETDATIYYTFITSPYSTLSKYPDYYDNLGQSQGSLLVQAQYERIFYFGIEINEPGVYEIHIEEGEYYPPGWTEEDSSWNSDGDGDGDNGGFEEDNERSALMGALIAFGSVVGLFIILLIVKLVFFKNSRRRVARGQVQQQNQQDQLGGTGDNTLSADAARAKNLPLDQIPIAGYDPTKHKRKKAARVTEDTMCLICLDQIKEVKFHPCSHVCGCIRCARQIYKSSNRCPLCRSAIESLEYTDLYSKQSEETESQRILFNEDSPMSAADPKKMNIGYPNLGMNSGGSPQNQADNAAMGLIPNADNTSGVAKKDYEDDIIIQDFDEDESRFDKFEKKTGGIAEE